MVRKTMRSACALGLIAGLMGADGSCDKPAKTLEIRGGLVYVNGKAFVPTGVYFWPDVSKPTGRNPFGDVASYGLNALVAYYEYFRFDRTVANQPDLDEIRRECERLGIYYLLGSPPKSVLEGKSDAQLETLFKGYTDKVKDSPQYLGWCFDEPEMNGIGYELMKRCVAAIRRHAAPQLVYFIFAPLDERWDDPDWPDMAAYAKLADIVGFDFYPVETGLPWPGYISKYRLEDFGWYVDRVRSWVTADTPIWVQQQGYRTGDLENPPTSAGRRPNAVETRFMTFQAIAHGAGGVFYFTGSRLGGAIPFQDPTWDIYIRQTSAAVRDLASVLASTESAEGVTVSAPDVRVLVRRLGGKTAIFAVRETDGSAKSVTLTLLQTVSGAFPVHGEGRTVSASGGKLVDSFDRYAVHVYLQE